MVLFHYYLHFSKPRYPSQERRSNLLFILISILKLIIWSTAISDYIWYHQVQQLLPLQHSSLNWKESCSACPVQKSINFQIYFLSALDNRNRNHVYILYIVTLQIQNSWKSTSNTSSKDSETKRRFRYVLKYN